MRRWGDLVLAALTAGALPLAAQQRGVARRGPAAVQLADSLVQRFVTPRLVTDEQLLPPVFVGDLGPPGKTILALTDSGFGGVYGGFALLDSAGTSVQRRLPFLEDNAGQSLDAVLFVTAPGDSVPLIVCMATYIYTRGSHSGEEYNANAVLRWDGHAFVHQTDVEQRIERATTAAHVRRILLAR